MKGYYRVFRFGSGLYSITVEKTGYKKTALERCVVSAEATQGVDIALGSW